MKNTISELKNSKEGFNIRVGHTEERISELKNRLFEIIQWNKKKNE